MRIAAVQSRLQGNKFRPPRILRTETGRVIHFTHSANKGNLAAAKWVNRKLTQSTAARAFVLARVQLFPRGNLFRKSVIRKENWVTWSFTFQDDLQLVCHHLKSADRAAVFWDDVPLVPRAAGVLKKVLARVGRRVDRRKQGSR